MSKIYLLAHSQRRFNSDFSCIYAHLPRKQCSDCGIGTSQKVPPLLYYWDEKFGDPMASWNEGHVCFWGDFHLLVADVGRGALQQLELPLTFESSQQVRTELLGETLVIEETESKTPGLFWARPTNFISVDLIENSHVICPTCGRFVYPTRQITRLRVKESEAIRHRLFTIRQNGGGPIFVSEQTKLDLEDASLPGLGFYPAGRTV